MNKTNSITIPIKLQIECISSLLLFDLFGVWIPPDFHKYSNTTPSELHKNSNTTPSKNR